jgi:putative ubiquitin-RnfH superfamily antitoxin RatB of RatAB toxin-antitoxin module
MSIPDLMTKNAHEYAKLMEELLAKAGDGIKSFILLNSEIDSANYKIDRERLEVEQKSTTSKGAPIQGQSDVEVSRKSDPIQGLKNVTGTGIAAKTGAEAIQQGKDNQAKTDSLIYLRSNLEEGVPVKLKDGATVTSRTVSDGIVEIEVEKDGQKQSIGKVSETGIVAVDLSYSNDRLEIIQELINHKEIEKSTQVTQEASSEAQPVQPVQTEAALSEAQPVQTKVTKKDLNNLQAYLYSDEYKKEHPGANRETANNKMQPHQEKYMKQARAQHGNDITTRDPILNNEQYEVDLAAEDVDKISVANEWAAKEEQVKQQELQRERGINKSR